MPSQLLQRLNRFLEQQQPRQTIMSLETVPRADHFAPPPASQTQNITPHWPGRPFGDPIPTVQCIVIHETSGWPTYAGEETFVVRYTCKVNSDRGIGPQYFVEPNGTAYTLIGDHDFAGDPRETWHAGWPDEHIDMNPFALGIENGDIGDSTVSPGNGTGPNWWALSTQAEDLTGMKLYLLLAPGGGQQDAVLIWIAKFAQEWVVVPATPTVKAHWALQAGTRPGFQGPGDIVDGTNPATARHLAGPRRWRNMLFTERNFRTLVLLCRLLVEQNGLPRNFPLLPYLSADGDWTDAALFRRLILAEQRGDEIAVQVGTTRAAIQANTPQFTQLYQAHPKETWSRLFGAIPGQGKSAAHPNGVASVPVTPCFRGILAHSMNGGHPCPGPLFDWHRFAREIWDWWWYPFDIETTGPSTTMRPYFQARKTTPLVDYYWDASGRTEDYNGLHLLVVQEETFLLPMTTPIYAMANGVVVAAQLAGNFLAAGGFLLVRHEVFRQQAANHRINYDLAPTFVWTLIKFLGNPQFNIPLQPPAQPAATPANNPSWLNRFIMRLRECELAVQFHNAHAATSPALRTGWAHNPDGTGPRSSIGQEIERDAVAYRTVADDLTAGRVAKFPLEATTDTTPVRVCLGDFLGYPTMTDANRSGVQVEIFSKEQLPVPGAAQRAVSASNEDWWAGASAAVRPESAVEMDLPANGMAWHYAMTDFLAWINGITWASEWEKYGVTVGGAPAPAPARPISRIVN
jgi:hypothetical protein